MKKQVKIRVMSIIDGEAQAATYEGEHDMDGDTHLVAYNDYTGNALTRNGMYLGPDKMLLHRAGGITCDMLFDPSNVTEAAYDVFGLKTVFALQTFDYSREISPENISVHLKYTLDDQSGSEPISGFQEITIEEKQDTGNDNNIERGGK